MRPLAFIAGLVLIVVPLLDAFETILQPRRVTHRFRFARAFYRTTWGAWRAIALRIRRGKSREAFLSVFGPLSLLTLIGAWVIGLVVGFALLRWSLRAPIRGPADLGTYLYLSASTFFTLGDLEPIAPLTRALGVVEAGLGFAFLAVIISYLPVLYQAFSQREVTISLLDARAGSPPSATQFLVRLASSGKLNAADSFLKEWEAWSAHLLESHLSFPVLSFYRSQHDNQSWVGTLTMILDTCALMLAELERSDTYQAQLTFAMARHAAVDLALVLKARPMPPAHDRLPPELRQRLHKALREAGANVQPPDHGDTKLAELRGMYEPFVNSIAETFLFALPPLVPDTPPIDNWQRSAWMQRAPGIGSLPAAIASDGDHF